MSIVNNTNSSKFHSILISSNSHSTIMSTSIYSSLILETTKFHILGHRSSSMHIKCLLNPPVQFNQLGASHKRPPHRGSLRRRTPALARSTRRPRLSSCTL